MKERPQRVAEAIKEDLMDLFRHEVKDPRVGFVSIVKVDVSKDLSQARVFFSVLGDDQAKKETLKGLQSAAGYLRMQLATRLSLRHTPELVFRLDESIEHGVRISELLGQAAPPTPANEARDENGE